LKGIQSLKNYKSLESIDFDQRKEKFHQDLEEERALEIINTDEIFTLEEAIVNLMIQQAMTLLKNHEYTVSQLINYRSDTFITS
jgi:hypothetical protein